MIYHINFYTYPSPSSDRNHLNSSPPFNPTRLPSSCPSKFSAASSILPPLRTCRRLLTNLLYTETSALALSLSPSLWRKVPRKRKSRVKTNDRQRGSKRQAESVRDKQERRSFGKALPEEAAHVAPKFIWPRTWPGVRTSARRCYTTTTFFFFLLPLLSSPFLGAVNLKRPLPFRPPTLLFRRGSPAPRRRLFDIPGN